MSTPDTLPEEFLQFIWENRLFYPHGLHTHENEPVEILSVGRRNTDSGPDFFNAMVKIGTTLWAGNVEIHKRASDWGKHNHTSDKAYENVILHVVEIADRQICRENGTPVATIEMSWPVQFTRNYRKLMNAKTWIGCQDQFFRIDPVLIRLGFHRLMVERLEEKTEAINTLLEYNKFDWTETFYQMLSRAFGFKVNSTPFELLAKSVPWHLLSKHKNNLFQLEALLFGASGIVSEELFGDNYPVTLQKEFAFLQKKYQLKKLESHIWKFMRLRPGNFPTIRISQLARLIFNSQGLFSQIMETGDPEKMRRLFKVNASPYWNSHYRFNRPNPRVCEKELGAGSIDMIIINVVVPFLFVYGEKQNRHHLKNRALEFLENLPPENNSVIRKWEKLGIDVRSAFDTQVLLQLKNRHCDRKMCLHCPIGNKLVAAGAAFI